MLYFFDKNRKQVIAVNDSTDSFINAYMLLPLDLKSLPKVEEKES